MTQQNQSLSLLSFSLFPTLLPIFSAPAETVVTVDCSLLGRALVMKALEFVTRVNFALLHIFLSSYVSPLFTVILLYVFL